MTPAELAVLAAEIKDDPLNMGYAAHLPDDPVRVVEKLCAMTQTMIKPMTASRALVWAGMGGYGKIVDTAHTPDHPGRDSCLAFRDNVLGGLPVDLNDPDVQQMFNGWEDLGIITAEQNARALAFATQPAARFEVLGIPTPTAHDVAEAMEIK